MKKLLLLAFALTLAFAGCKAAPDNGSNGKNLLSEEINPVDIQIYQQSIDSENLELCNAVEDETLKSECKEIISGNLILRDAITKLDLSLCESIANKQIKQSCEIQVESNLDKEAEAQKLREKMDSQTEKAQELQNNNDLEGCKALEFKNLVKQCQVNVASNLARENKDPSYCDIIEDEFVKNSCVLMAQEQKTAN